METKKVDHEDTISKRRNVLFIHDKKNTTRTINLCNSFLLSMFYMTLPELRIFLLMINKISEGRDLVENGRGVLLSSNEYNKFYNIKGFGGYACTRKATMKLRKRFIASLKINEKNEEVLNIKTIISQTETSLDDNGSQLKLVFTPEIIDFLNKKEGNFTQLYFEELKKVRSSFEFQLFLILREAKFISPKTTKTIDGGYIVRLSIDWIKNRLLIGKELDSIIEKGKKVIKADHLKLKSFKYKSFKQNQLNPTINNINKTSTNIFVSVTETKEGKSVSFLDFTIKYKESENDVVFTKPVKKLKRKPQDNKERKVTKEMLVSWAKENIEIMRTYEKEMREFKGTSGEVLTSMERKQLKAFIEVLNQ